MTVTKGEDRKQESEGGSEQKEEHERGRESFVTNLNSFQTMSKEPWQHGLKQTLPLILLVHYMLFGTMIHMLAGSDFPLCYK